MDKEDFQGDFIMENMVTTSAIAKQLNTPFYRVQYLLVSRRIKESERIGNCRLFPQSVVAQLRREIEKIDARRACNNQEVGVA